MSAKQIHRQFGCLRKAVKLLPVCVWLLSLSGTTNGIKIFVKEHEDAVLPCLISTKEDLTGKIFDWRKDGQVEVFLYNAGIHYNNGHTGQDQQFKGRVSHFQDQLKNGNASIEIRNTKWTDRGTYRCIFPHLHSQTYIELVVERTLTDRSGEGNGVSPKPQITTLDATKDWSVLQCEVQGASPQPKVEWQDRAGNILPAEEPQVLQNGGSYSVSLNITVTKTDHYRCVATQEELSHRVHAKTFVFISEKLCEDQTTKEVIGWPTGFILGAVVVAVLIAAVQAGLVATKCITVRLNRGEARRKQPDSL